MYSFVPRHLVAALLVLALAGIGVSLPGLRDLWAPRPADRPALPPLPEVVHLADGVHRWSVRSAKLGLDPVRRTLNLSRALRVLDALAAHARYPGRPARLVIGDDGRLAVVPSRMSRTLDVSASLRRLETYVAAPAPITVRLVLRKRAPRVTTAELEAIDGPISEFVTRFNPGDRPRTRNLRLVAEHLDGAVALPEEVFSFNRCVGPRDVRDGYRTAHIFVQGKIVEGLGGGTCQVSSTLYNAVLLAGLPVVERNSHSITVPYVLPGRDATVYYGERDFRFRNRTGAAIYIRAEAGRNRLRIVLYGSRQTGPRVEVVDHVRRAGDRVFARVSRVYVDGERIVRREPLSNDSYEPLELANRRALAAAR